MAVASNEEGKKWIQASVAFSCILLGYIIINFFQKMAEWFALEAKVPYYNVLAQGLSIVVGLATYVVILKQPKSANFLANVYQEVLKVVWPNKEQTWRHTFVIMVAVTIMGFIFGFFDFGANFLLGLVNK